MKVETNNYTASDNTVEKDTLNENNDSSPNSTVYLEPEDDSKDAYEDNETETPTLNKKKYHNISNDVRIKLIDAVENKGEKIKHAAKRLLINYSSAKSICQVFKREGRSKKKSIKKSLADDTFTREASQDENYTINHLLSPRDQEQGSKSPDVLTQIKNRLLGGRNTASTSNPEKIEYQPYKQVHTSNDSQGSSVQDFPGNEANQLQHIDRIIAQNNNILKSAGSSSDVPVNNQNIATTSNQNLNVANTFTNPNMLINDNPANSPQYIMQPNGYGYPAQPFPTMQVPVSQAGGYPIANMFNSNPVIANSNNSNNPNFRPVQVQPMYFANPNTVPIMMAPNQNQFMYSQQGYPMPIPGPYPQQNGEMMMVNTQGNQNAPMAYYPNYQQPPMMYQPQQPQYVMAVQPQGYCMPQQQQQQPMIMVPAASYFRDQNASVQQQQAFMYPDMNYPQQMQMFSPNPVMNNTTHIPTEAANEQNQSHNNNNNQSNDNNSNASIVDQKTQPTEPSGDTTAKFFKVLPKVNEKKEDSELATSSKKVVFNAKQVEKLSMADRLRELKSKDNKGFIGRGVGLRCFAQAEKLEDAN